MRSTNLTVGQSVRVVMALGWADFILKYRGSFLGYLWSFAVPLVKFIVMYHIFKQFVTDIPQYALYLFLGLILWEHFAMTTMACISMLQEKSAVIKKIVFPRMLLIMSVGWMHLIILSTYSIIFFLFVFVLRVSIPVSALYLPVIFAQATLIALGVGMLLSAFSLKFRDIQHLWFVALQILFWLTPVMYVYQPSSPVFADIKILLSGNQSFSPGNVLDAFIRFQPLSILIHDARRVLLYPDRLGIPSLTHVIGFSAVCVVIFAAGMIVFQRRSRYFIQEY